jgi:hypothetical protein
MYPCIRRAHTMAHNLLNSTFNPSETIVDNNNTFQDVTSLMSTDSKSSQTEPIVYYVQIGVLNSTLPR